ncbi:universal stress protein [Coraliomargarita parva]|uniref:universal stress protein n=1 Tax=Coraliomargarita parva TaxID=3014050 RepID=UPI0022B5A4FA|nr:universal stress protein [Coraliomargarita parva]
MKKLLVCTDGSNYSEECCRYGAWLALQSGATVDVLYVTDLRQFEIPAVADLSGSLGIQPFEGMISQMQEVERHKAGFVEEHAMRVLREAGMGNNVSFHHETGLLVDVIEQYQDEVDLILLGKRGENANFATEHLGSMLERVVRAAKKPCLVTSRKFKPVQQVAIAYDGGISARKALDYLSAEPFFKQVQLHLVTVSEGSDETEASGRLAEAEAKLKTAGMEPGCQLLTGEVESAIASYVDKSQIDLLIAGAYGHSRIRELIIGSTTTELLRRCRVPVLCFR